MEHYVTWSDLFALLTFLATYTGILYGIFHNKDNHNKKK